MQYLRKYLENKDDYQKQIILKISMVVLFFCLLFGLLLVRNIYLNAKNDMNTVKNMKLTQVRQNFDFRIDMAVNVVENLKRTPEVMGYAANDGDYLSMAKIFTRLTENQNAYTQQNFLLAVQKPYSDTVITPTGTMRAVDFYSQYGISAETAAHCLKDDYAFLTDAANQDAKQFVIQLNETVGHTASPITFFVILDKADILSGSLGEGEQIAASADGQPLLALPATPLDRSILDNIYTALVREKKGGQDIADITLSDNYVKVSFSNTKKFRDLSFLLLSERGYSQKAGELFGFLFAPMMAALFLLGLYFAMRIAKGIYEPIMTLSASYKEALEERHLSSEYAKDNFLNALLRGLLSEEETKQRAALLSLPYTEDSCVAGIIELADYIPDEEDAPAYDIKMFDRIEKALKDAVRAHIPCDVTAIDKGRFAILLYTGDIARIKPLLSAIAADLTREYGVNIRAILGHTVQNMTQAGASYLSAKKAAATVSSYSNQVVYSAEEMSPQLVENSYYYPIEKEKLLITYILRDRREEAFALLDEVLRANYEEKTLSPVGNSNFLIAITGTVNRILQESGLQIGDVFEDGTLIFPELKMLKTSGQLKHRILEIFTQLAHAVAKAGEETSSKLSESLLGFVNDNYKKDISLVDIAAAFNLSAGYISALFKKTTGKNFKDYLTMRRLAVAKQLMQEKRNWKVKDIAQQIGYNNVNTFIRIFKKYEGISPGEYQAQAGKEQAL